MRLNFYLFKKDVAKFEDALLAKKLSGDECYINATPPEVSTEFEYNIYLQRNKCKRPKWLDFIWFFSNLSEEEKNNIKNQVNSFVILMKVRERIFAVTGGFGFNAVDKDKIEPNFGLISTLNAIDQNKIKFFDVKNIDVNTRQKRIITSKASEVKDFELDFNQDLVRIISGKPIDGLLGTKLQGSDSLMLTADIEFEDLGKKCSQLLDEFEKEDYKKNFEFIDNIIPIKNKQITDELDKNLITAINNKDDYAGDKINISYPDQFDYDKCENFKVYGLRRNELFPEINLTLVYQLLQGQNNVSLDDIKNKIRIVGFDDNGNPMTSSVPLYNFFTFETEINNELYVLTNKQWFNVNKNYLQNIEDNLKDIVYLEDILPNYSGGSENDYNKTVAQDKKYVLLDCDNVNIPGTKSSIEICDLYDKNTKNLIHVKKEYGSSKLSHLFSQGSVSADCIAGYKEFQQKFANKIGVSDIKPNELIISYAIITKKTGNLIEKLPVFSKINLFKHFRDIKKLGMTVQLIKIISEV